jgi:hypothetical protein
MEDAKLPDLNKLRSVKKRLKDLPDQKSATDTSNWENRTDTAPHIDKVTKKRKDRQLDYILETPMKEKLITREQAEKILQERTKKTSK